MTDTHALTRRIDIPAAGRYSLDPARSSLTLRTRLFGLHPLRAAMYITGGQIDVDPAVPRATVTAAISAASFSTDNPTGTTTSDRPGSCTPASTPNSATGPAP